MNQTKRKIAIAGIGMVGGALAKWFKDAILYDPPKGIGSVEELNKADIIFICVPTPFEDYGFDRSYIAEVVEQLEGNKIVVIKSTVIPGITQTFQEEYPQHKFLFNPEFLTEETADQDIKYPDRQIIGYTKQSYAIAQDIMIMLPQAPFERIIPAKEAEMIKYFNNAWLATKVIFANQMYDLCQELGIDYDVVKLGASADKRMTGTSHLEVWHKNKRGYAGRCLPKDVKSLIQFADKNNINMSLLKEVDKINTNLKMITPYKQSPYQQFKELRESKKIVANSLEGKKFKNILEVGCQWGENLVAIKGKFPDKEIVGVDMYKPVVSDAKEVTGLDIRVGNLFDLQFKNKEFDVVFTNALFCMIEPNAVEEGFKEMLRVAKKHIILIELETKELVGRVNGGRTGANWVELLKKYGLEATREKVTKEVWDAEPWISNGYIYYATLRAGKL